MFSCWVLVVRCGNVLCQNPHAASPVLGHQNFHAVCTMYIPYHVEGEEKTKERFSVLLRSLNLVWETVYGKGQKETKSHPCVLLRVRMWAHMHPGTYVEVRGQHWGIGSLLQWRFQGIKFPMVRLVWQACVPTEPPCECEQMYLKKQLWCWMFCTELHTEWWV